MLVLVLQLALLGALLLIIDRVVAYYQYYATLNRIPSPPTTGSTAAGHLDVMTDTRRHHTLLGWSRENPVFLLRLYWMRVVVVSHPLLIAQVLNRSVDADKPPILTLTNPLISAKGHSGMFSALSSKSPYWQLARKGTAKAFNPQNLRNRFHHIAAAAREACQVIAGVGPKSPVDVNNLLLRQSLDVIGRVGFETDFQAIQGYVTQARGDVFDNVSLGLEEVTLRIGNPLRRYLKFLPSVKEGERRFAGFRAHMQKLLEELRARGPPADSDTSLAAHLLRLRDPHHPDRPLPDDRLLPEIGTFFIAGYETTGNQMTWALYLLANHPEAEAKVVEELAGLGLLATPDRPEPRPVEFEDLSKLPWLNACLKESMRLMPVTAEASSRCFPHDIKLGPYTIPANTWIWCYAFALQRSPSVWEDPDAFKPERWLEPGAEYYTPPAAQAGAGAAGHALPSSPGEAGQDEGPSTAAAAAKTEAEGPEEAQAGPAAGSQQRGMLPSHPSFSGAANSPARALRYLPFSAGPRDCIGQSLAKLNAAATLATLLGRFSFALAPEMAGPGGVQDVIRLTMQPANGLKMICTPRA